MSKLPRKNISETATQPVPNKLGALTQNGDVNLAVKEEIQRRRRWSQTHPAYSRRVPNDLRNVGLSVRGDVSSIAAYDRNGTPRLDRTTVDDVAREIFRYVIEYVLPKEQLVFLPTKARTGKMLVRFEKTAPGWERIELKPVPKKEKSPSQVVLAYRLPSDVIEKIEEVAGPRFPAKFNDAGKKINHPYRFTVSPGAVMVVLLRRGIDDYLRGEFNFRIGQDEVHQKLSGWVK